MRLCFVLALRDAMGAATLPIAASAQTLVFFRVAGQPATPGDPPIEPQGGLAQPAVAADGGTLAHTGGGGNLIPGGFSGSQILAYQLGGGAICRPGVPRPYLSGQRRVIP